MTSKGLEEMFEGDIADKCTEKVSISVDEGMSDPVKHAQV